MKIPDIPSVQGVTKMTPLEMNSVHFNKNHTVLTPQVLETMKTGGATSIKKTKIEYIYNRVIIVEL